MTLNFPGPYQLRYRYTVSGREHVHRTNLKLTTDPPVGTPFSSISAIPRSLVPVALDTAVDAYVLLLLPFFNSAAGNIVNAELWKYAPDSFDASFVSVYDISAAGTSATATYSAGQIIWTFRTEEGGIMRLDLMDTVSTEGITQSPPYGAGIVKTLSDFVISASNWIVARDTSYPIANLAYHPGRNEQWFKRIYRP